MSEADITEDEYRDRRKGAQQALHEVIEHEAIVSVEGPAGVALAAAQARRSLDHELAVILAHRQAQGSREAVEQAGGARLEAVGRMTTAARRVFNGESTFAAPAACRAG
ncbi:hypothetical protein [Streptomyces sp. NPDC059552]|uniref:hypothetical protein n=1 Tax=Streptomyces sp. NPDC059552 TaxID=3346862 RepID=UPI0036BDB2F6